MPLHLQTLDDLFLFHQRDGIASQVLVELGVDVRARVQDDGIEEILMLVLRIDFSDFSDFSPVPLPFLATLIVVLFFKQRLLLQNVNDLLHLDSLQILYRLVIKKILRICVHVQHLLTRSKQKFLELLELVLGLYRHLGTADACSERRSNTLFVQQCAHLDVLDLGKWAVDDFLLDDLLLLVWGQ